MRDEPEIFVLRVYRRLPEGRLTGVIEIATTGRSMPFDGVDTLLELLQGHPDADEADAWP